MASNVAIADAAKSGPSDNNSGSCRRYGANLNFQLERWNPLPPVRLSPIGRSCNLTTISGSAPHCGGLNFPNIVGRTIMKTLTGRACLCLFGCAGLALALAAFPAAAQSTDPIKIGVIGEESSVAGASLTKAAVMAADDINAHGGVNGRKIEVITYDNHSSASDAVRAFQRAVNQDKVVAVIGSYISEVVLALEPWSARLHVPFITPGAASNLISKAVHDDYDHYKYTFHGWLTSAFIAQAICDYTS